MMNINESSIRSLNLLGLYTAGELGSIWGSLYTGGCNLAECFITGKLAAEHAMTRNT